MGTGSSPRFDRVIGIVGHPTTPDVAWSDEQLEALRGLGVETLQLAIAWAWRPANEVLNLEHLDDPRNVTEWRRRIEAARRHGFRTLAHFGLPVGPSEDATTCILDPAVRQSYAGRLRRLFDAFPEIDDVMIYTYDQLAWLCSEFGNCPRCHGVPLHERLVPFLELLVDAVQEGKPRVRLWWEPWELSAGQTFMIADRIRPDHFGLLLHSTIAEVQFVNRTDQWFRNLSRLAASRGVPVIGEGFFGGAGEDVDPLTHLACPRLVYQQLAALRDAEGVVGVKEYYGFVPAHFSVNARLFGAFLRQPNASLDDLLTPIAARYGRSAAPVLREAWEATAFALELFPWDASWLLRRIFDGTRSGDGRSVKGASWMTPAWQANRRGFYMVTDEPSQHPWLREDVGLRALHAARAFDKAATLLERAVQEAQHEREDVMLQLREVRRAASVSEGYARALIENLHCSS